MIFTLPFKWQVSGFKKVLNYMKRVTDELRYKRSLSREEVNKTINFVLSMV